MKRSFYKEKLKIPNSDTMNNEKEIKTNNSISDFLMNLGEKSAALYLEEKLNPATPYSKEIEKIEKERNKELTKISMINSGILSRLDSIEKSLRKGQDTGVNPLEKKEKTALQAVKEIHTVDKKNDDGWFEMLLGGLLGAGMLAFLKGFKNLGPVAFIMDLMKRGWTFIKDKIIALATGIAKTVMKPIQELIEWVIEKLAKMPGFEDFNRKKPNKTGSKEPQDSKDSKTNTSGTTDDSKDKKTMVKGKGKKGLILGAATGLAGYLGLDYLTDKDDENGVKAVSEKQNFNPNLIPDIPDLDKSTKLKTPEIDKSKIEKETAKAVDEKIAKKVGGAAGKSISKKIPLIGLGAAGGFAVDRIVDGDYVGAGMEMASGILGTLGAITFGAGTAASVGVDAALLARDIERISEEVITKLDDNGIIDKGFFGDTTVEKWDEVEKLSLDELTTLHNLEDLDKNDKMRVGSILYRKELEKVKEPENIEDFNDTGVKVIFNDREILADALLKTNDELEEFLLQNPLTEENSEKKESIIDGKRVIEIKYKDEILNEKYLELKEKFDEDYAKYKTSREKQLLSLGESYDIGGSLFSESDFNRYQETSVNSTTGVTPNDFAKTTNINYAREDVTNALLQNYGNVTIPTGPLADRIKKHEGLRLQVYTDTMGYPTIGYGHKLKPGEDYLKAGITKEQAEQIFAKDFEYHLNAAKKIPSFSEHPQSIQDALVDMTFNMGPAWYKKWPNTMKKLQAKDYAGVEKEILGSKYATQVKGRALVNAKAFGLSTDVKNASENVSTPKTDTLGSVPNTPENTQEVNINKLDKTNAIEQKTDRVQMIEDINKNLVKNTTPNNILVNNVNNQTVGTSVKPETVPLSSIFNSYS